MPPLNLTTLFEPKAIALIGASHEKGKVGYDILQNLVSLGFQGKVFPINPKGGKILKQTVFKSLAEIKTKIDLAIIVVPAMVVPKVLEECGELKIKNIIIISAGFKESGEDGAKREQTVKQLIQKYQFNLIGPNCLGIINTAQNLNASFAEGLPRKGNVGLISQSGAMAVAITDWAYTHNLGFSKIISLGNKAGLNEIDLLEYLEKDPQTKVILMYLESIENGLAFMRLAQRITKKKPIIALKSGTSQAGVKAISSHTGSLAGSDAAVKAAFQQSGILRAETVEDFFDYARAFSAQPLPAGNQVAIISNAGGPAILATDNLSQSQLKLARFLPQTLEILKQNLPPAAALHNPIDLVGDALSNRYEVALKTVLQDKNVQAVIVLLTPQAMTDVEKIAEIVSILHKKFPQKTLLTCFLGGKKVAQAIKALNTAKIPNFDYPSSAVETLEKMYLYQKWQKQKNKTASIALPVPGKIIKQIRTVLSQCRGQLPLTLSFELLQLYHIKTPPYAIAKTPQEAIQLAGKFGYPVVLKICSPQIIHKTDAGGVQVSLKNAREVQKAFLEIVLNAKKYNPQAEIRGVQVQEMTTFGREVIIGMKRDPQFGPLLMFGLGGIYVEALKDVTFRLAPLTLQEAEAMIYEIKAIALLKGIRGEAPADLKKLAEILCHIAQMSQDFPEIQELDINPLIIKDRGQSAIAIDARMIV